MGIKKAARHKTYAWQPAMCFPDNYVFPARFVSPAVCLVSQFQSAEYASRSSRSVYVV